MEAVRKVSKYEDQVDGLEEDLREKHIERLSRGECVPSAGVIFLDIISNLERNGYLRRESLASDGRYKKLVLTEQTLAIRDDITSRINEYMQSIFVGISEDDLKVFEKVILQMTENTK